eukprot:ANDGO_02378.mRNA.1 hypothetical protein
MSWKGFFSKVQETVNAAQPKLASILQKGVQLLSSDPPEKQASMEWNHVIDYFGHLEQRDRKSQLKEPLRSEVFDRLDRMIALLIQESQDPASERRVFAFFKENNVVTTVCRLCQQDIPIGCSSRLLQSLSRLIQDVPFEFLSVASNLRPISDCLSNIVFNAPFRDQYSSELATLLLKLSTRLQRDERLLGLFMPDENTFPIMSCVLEMFTSAPSGKVGEKIKNAIIALCCISDSTFGAFAIGGLHPNVADVVLHHLMSLYADLDRRNFHIYDTKNETATKEFFRHLSFVDRLLQVSNKHIQEYIQSRLEVEVGSSFLRAEVFFSDESAQAGTTEHALVFLREIVLSIESNGFLRAIVSAIFVNHPSRSEALLSRLFSEDEHIVLGVLDFLSALLSRNHWETLWILVGQYFQSASFLNEGTSSVSVELFSQKDREAIFALFPAIDGVPSENSVYAEDAKSKIMSNLMSLHLMSFQLQDPALASVFRFPEKEIVLRNNSGVPDVRNCLLLSSLLRKFSQFLSNSSVVNIQLTGLLSSLCVIPCPLLLCFLFCPSLDVSPDCPSLCKSLRFLSRQILSDLQYPSISERLPNVLAHLGISDAPAEQSSELEKDSNFDVSVAILLEFKREFTGTLEAWAGSSSWLDSEAKSVQEELETARHLHFENEPTERE